MIRGLSRPKSSSNGRASVRCGSLDGLVSLISINKRLRPGSILPHWKSGGRM